ncbi:U2 small nuclear ribonucleoprotein auxiliary factor 35 kDa subunit-related protein 1 isoform X1 [Anastrepha ludens]|uniref:U2 small nuclear ribonucleoprotein auxiliary factor 35 kDa subunit-related protein 1 isoform X1 n=1 Tax=Anastrepha ludens TaxID=28586 RepID=UPI0023AFA3C0|nr:U2 small nuclear ribonucleoprotein auxiliary factor 35 kDa subunit-related protein 1 isoform X1 [Anastrepha ludens]
MSGKSTTKRPWRKELKKQQRKRRRRKEAVARDLRLEEEEAHNLKDPAYQQLLQQQVQLEEEQKRAAEKRHAEEEEIWLRRDLLAQREFRLKQQQRTALEAAEVAKRIKQAEELAAKEAEQRRRHEEHEKSKAAAAAEFEQMMECMENFLNNDGPPPAELRRVVESRPNQNLCILYERTNCCRYGAPCVNNHRRPLLSNIIVVRHFFMHPLLEVEQHKEYANADGSLELSEQDLREAYEDFFEDVLPELEEFGYILNFRAVRNVLRHMRGHVFVEYVDERSALKAFIKLQRRYYAGRQLNVEFSCIKSWRSAICGLSLAHKCPKGDKCNYLHLFKNPGNKCSMPLDVNRTPSTRAQMVTPLMSWNTVTANDVKQSSRNWRWSESPELEIPTRKVETERMEKQVSDHDDCSKSKQLQQQHQRNKINSDTKLENTSSSQSKECMADADANTKSKERQRRHKHVLDKPPKRHRREHSRHSERAKKRQDRHSEVDSRSGSSQSYKDGSGKRRRSTTSSDDSQNFKDKSRHSSIEEKFKHRKHRKSSSPDCSTPKKHKHRSIKRSSSNHESTSSR